jgi:endonuclease/exonuclease/phosphatase family metal-dependent hydrolase
MGKKRMAAAWQHLASLEADIILLQEAVLPAKQIGSSQVVGAEHRSEAWTYVYAATLKAEAVSEVEIDPVHGRAAAGRFRLLSDAELLVASVHTDTTSGSVARKNTAIFKALTERFAGTPFLIGGDLNSCRLAEGHAPGWIGHRAFFDGLANNGLVSCSETAHGIECQTFFRRHRGYPFQNDHLFVSVDPGPRVVDVHVPDPTPYVDIQTHDPILSDHLPIVAELEL